MWGKKTLSQKPYLILLVIFVGVSIGSASALIVHNENVIINGQFKVTGGEVAVEKTGSPSSITVQNDGFSNTIKFSDLTSGQEQIFQFRQIATGERLDIFDVTNAKIFLSADAGTGNVGIGGQTSPQEQLDVNGHIHLSGVTAKITADGDICIGAC